MSKHIVFSAIAALALMSAADAQAGDRRDNKHGHWRNDHRHHGHYNNHKSHSRVSFYFGSSYQSYPRYYPATTYRYVTVQQPVYVPTPVYYTQNQTANNSYCREFTRNIMIGGRVQKGYGNACQQPDGSWQFVD